jgi:predicted PurR-regulated permease PerM
MARIVQSHVEPAGSTSAEEPDARLISNEPVVSEQGMPRGTDIRGVFQGGLFMLALLAALYAGREIVLPIVLAVILNLLLQPALRMLERLYVPRMLGALLLIALLFATIVAFVTGMSGPAGSWAAKLPEGVPRLQEHLSFLRAPIDAVRQFLQQAQGYVSGDSQSTTATSPALGADFLLTVFSSTRAFAAGFLETILVLFFLLLSGDTLLRRLVEVLPRFSDKRQAIEISQHIEHDISAYLITITIMNAAVGIATALAMWLCGLGDPILWGAVAFLLNYIPILGPMIGVVMFTSRAAYRKDVVAGLVASWAIPSNPPCRRRNHNADAVGAAFHAQSPPCHCCSDLLVLDVGRARRDPCSADARNHKDHLRQEPDAGALRALS